MASSTHPGGRRRIVDSCGEDPAVLLNLFFGWGVWGDGGMARSERICVCGAALGLTSIGGV